MSLFDWALAGVSLALTAQSAYSAALMLYAWEDDEKLKRNRVPASFEPPRHHFTVMLPARHEEQVIQQTIQRTVELNYPRELVQILVVIEAGDGGTIAEVRAKQAELAAQGRAPGGPGLVRPRTAGGRDARSTVNGRLDGCSCVSEAFRT